MSKREQILTEAINLFSVKGVDATSTRLISEKAGVSEGLIFKHFKSKEGLLEQILEQNQMRISPIITSLQEIEEPKQTLRYCIEAMKKIPREDYSYWKLCMMVEHTSGFKNGFIDQLEIFILDAFKSLKFARATLETQLLTQSLKGIFSTMLIPSNIDSEALLTLMLRKYQV